MSDFRNRDLFATEIATFVSKVMHRKMNLERKTRNHGVLEYWKKEYSRPRQGYAGPRKTKDRIQWKHSAVGVQSSALGQLCLMPSSSITPLLQYSNPY